MMNLIWIAGALFMLAIIGFAFYFIRTSSKEAPDSSKIANTGDINYNNNLGKFGVDGL